MAKFDPALVNVALSLAYHFGARGPDAEDAAQEALLKLLTYDAVIEEPIAWLYVVVRRLQRRRVRSRQAPLPKPSPSVDPWPAVESSIDVSSLIAQLPVRQRLAVSLSIAGYTERESARLLGCSVKAGEKTLFKARQRLRSLTGSS